jgi:hypothetical protein
LKDEKIFWPQYLAEPQYVEAKIRLEAGGEEAEYRIQPTGGTLKIF